MREVTLFYIATGLFKRVIGVPEHALARNVPRGFGVKVGVFDPLSQRVDLQTGLVVDYQPPRPSDDHEWRENVENGRPRWVKKLEIVERERLRSSLLRQIEGLERSQARPLRELIRDPRNARAKERLETIDEEIAALRAQLPT